MQERTPFYIALTQSSKLFGLPYGFALPFMGGTVLPLIWSVSVYTAVWCVLVYGLGRWAAGWALKQTIKPPPRSSRQLLSPIRVWMRRSRELRRAARTRAGTNSPRPLRPAPPRARHDDPGSPPLPVQSRHLGAGDGVKFDSPGADSYAHETRSHS